MSVGDGGAVSFDEIPDFDDFSASIGSVTLYSQAGRLSTRENRLGSSMGSQDAMLSISVSSKVEEDLIHASSKVEGLVGYDVSGIDPEVKNAYVEVINRILVRENALINVRKISQSMDILYWKYCVFRIESGVTFARDKRVRRLRNGLLRCQEELCVAMERLVETHIDPADKADKIKAMQQEWKRLGGTGDQALWNRFKTAADKAFEPCALFFAEQKQLKEASFGATL